MEVLIVGTVPSAGTRSVAFGARARKRKMKGIWLCRIRAPKKGGPGARIQVWCSYDIEEDWKNIVNHCYVELIFRTLYSCRGGRYVYIYISGFHTWNEKIAITQKKKKQKSKRKKQQHVHILHQYSFLVKDSISPEEKQRKKRWEKIPCSYFTVKTKTLLIEDYEKTHVYLKIKKLKRKRQKLKGKKNNSMNIWCSNILFLPRTQSPQNKKQRKKGQKKRKFTLSL